MAREVEAYFETAPAHEVVTRSTVEKGHGRIETRIYTDSKETDWIKSGKHYPNEPRFENINTIVKVANRIEYADKCTFDTRFYPTLFTAQTV